MSEAWEVGVSIHAAKQHNHIPEVPVSIGSIVAGRARLSSFLRLNPVQQLVPAVPIADGALQARSKVERRQFLRRRYTFRGDGSPHNLAVGQADHPARQTDCRTHKAFPAPRRCIHHPNPKAHRSALSQSPPSIRTTDRTVGSYHCLSADPGRTWLELDIHERASSICRVIASPRRSLIE